MEADMGFNQTEYLVDRFLNDIIRLSLVYVRNMDDAQDIAQQVFITYLQKKPVFNDENHAKSWLFKVAVNMSKNHIRLQQHNNISYDELEGVLSTDNDTLNKDKTEREEAVFAAVMRLKRIYREIIHLYYYSEYDTNEISKILGIPASSVRSRLTRARAALEKELKGGIGDAERGLQECNE